MSNCSLDNLDFIDIHYHANPDLFKRRHNINQVGQIYKSFNAGLVLKSHLGSTSIQATIAQQLGYFIFPSLVLNNISGGIHYKNILKALAEYTPLFPSRLIVDFPTITGRKHSSNLVRTPVHPNLTNHLMVEETIFNDNNKLKSEVIDILKCSADYNIVLSTGHASKQEIYALIEACEKYKVPSLLLNQPANPLTGLNAEDLLEIVLNTSFIWIEQTALTYLLKYQDENDFYKVLKNVNRVIYSSDLGQTSQMDIKEWVKTTQLWFAKCNLSKERKEEICLLNPLKLIKI
jgi:hypothetical protein